MDETYAPEIVMDRESSTPLYEQIARPIEAAILSGELPAGALIEDEVSMAQRLDVARPTARRALQELANKGLLTIEGLQKADLSNNNISEIPDDLFEIPAQVSENFDLRRNPLSEQSLTRLKHYYRQTGVQLNVNLSNPMEINLGTEQFPNYGDPTAGVIVDPVVQPIEE